MKLNLPDYLNDDQQNVIYRQINLMMVGSLQANQVQLCTKGRSVLTVLVLCGALSICTCCHLLNCSLRSCILVVQICCTSPTCTGSQLLGLEVHSLRNLFLLFLVPQMSSDCLGLLLGLTLPLHPLLYQTGLMHLNETVVEHVSLVWICVKLLGVKVASGCL